MVSLVVLCLLGGAAAVRGPAGAGQPEDTMSLACEECAKHSEYLDKGGEDCVCHATDIMGTFENDATKTSTKKVGTSPSTRAGKIVCATQPTSWEPSRMMQQRHPPRKWARVPRQGRGRLCVPRNRHHGNLRE